MSADRPAGSNRDRDEIIAVIEAETAAWIERDPAKWAACWLQNERAQHVNARPSVGARRLTGFDEIRGYFLPLMEAAPDSKIRPEDIRHEHMQISLGTDMAWVTFDQVIPVSAPSDSAPGRHHQIRILEKVRGEWKIAAIFHIPNRIGYYRCPWVRVDRVGRIIEIGSGADVALRQHGALQIVGQRLVGRQKSSNGKLREALAEADRLIGRRQGRSPMPLVLSDPDNNSFQLCWVSIADMMIVILINEDELVARRIARAGEAYGLTAAQQRVAVEIAEGIGINRTAEALGVQPNTVRTHVKRMFERVGVHGQAALVRALLSVESPAP